MATISYQEVKMRSFPWLLEDFFETITPGSRDDDWTWNQEFHELTNTAPHDALIKTLIDDIKQNGIKEPIVIGTDNRCWDGHHRVVAAIHLGMKQIPCIYHAEKGIF